TPTPTATPTGTPTPTATPTSTPTPAATPTPAGCLLGDLNCDGFVDVRDYGIWRQQFGATDCGNPADADGNCLVDIRDYGIWRQHFGDGTEADRQTRAALPAGSALHHEERPARLLGSDQAARGAGGRTSQAVLTAQCRSSRSWAGCSGSADWP